MNNPTDSDSQKMPDAPEGSADGLCSAIEEQRKALSEARQRIIARYEHVETWLKQPVPENILANWRGITEGLRQARRIIGAMWDELPVPKPQAVIDHEAHMSLALNDMMDHAAHQCAGCRALSKMAHWENLCPSEIPGCIGSTITPTQPNAELSDGTPKT